MALFTRKYLLVFVLMLLSLHNIFGVRVVIVNELSDKLDLTVHCKSKDDDLGVQLLHHDKSFEFNFKNNIFGSTLFFCSFQWNGAFHWFDIYKDSRDSCDGCKWVINNDGPCFFGTFKCYEWNK